MKEPREQFQILRKRLLEKIENAGALSDDEIIEKINEIIMEAGREFYLSLKRKEELQKELFNSIRKLDILQELIDDDSITEVMVNGTEGIFIEKNGRLIKWDKNFFSKQKIEDLVQSIAAKSNRIVNETVPIADARLENGARVNIVLPPAAINGPIITIRQFPSHPIHMRELIAWNAVTKEAAEFLRQLVIAGYNIFISGGTGSGKTTFLNALSDFIPKEERII